MNTPVPDLTPPGKNTSKPKDVVAKAPNGTSAPKADAKPKKEKPPVDPNAPKKERAARTDYGYRPDAVIGLATEKDVTKLRGQRKSWHDKIVSFNGKKVSEFLEANKQNEKDPPRGWVRFFAQEGFITLTGGTVPTPTPAPAKVEGTPPAPSA